MDGLGRDAACESRMRPLEQIVHVFLELVFYC